LIRRLKVAKEGCWRPDSTLAALPNIDGPTRKPERLHAGAFLLLLFTLGLTVAVYHIGLDGPFLLDDGVNLVETQIDALDTTDIREQLFSVNWPYPGARGLTRASFALTRYFSGDEPKVFKYQNLMLHLLSGLLVFWLLLLLMHRRPPLGDAVAPAYLAAVVSALWLLHPLQVSTVLYPVQRLVILSSLFMLAALIAYTKGRLLAATRPLAGLAVAFVGVGLFTALGLLSKEIAVLTPMLIGLIEVFILGFAFQRADGLRTAKILPWLFTALWLLPVTLGAMFASMHPALVIGGYEMRDFSLAERALTELHVLLLYLKLILLPLPNGMSLFHDDFPITRAVDIGTLLVAMLHMALILLAVAMRKRAPWLGFGILWFYACHTLESTVVALELVFEHRNYLALLGPVLVVVLLIGMALRAASTRRLILPTMTAIALLLAFNTHARALVWSNMELLLRSNYEQHPTSTRVLAGLITLKLAQGEREQAMQHLQELEGVSDIEPAPLLGAIELQCSQPTIDLDLFERALGRLESGIISAFAAHSLRSLTDRSLRGHCPALTTEQLRHVLRSAAANGRFGPGVACHVFEMNTRFDIEHGRHADAQAHLSKALAACGGRYYSALINVLLVFSTDRGHLSWTLELLSDAATRPDKSDITDAFPDWISAEMITPAGIAQLRASGQ
jgi:protein O-mannosyl-transferase